MTGIEISYSWGDEEPIIECKEENAWNTILDLVAKEVKVSTVEGESNVNVFFNYGECEATLHYQADDQYCYYRFVKSEEDIETKTDPRSKTLAFIQEKIEEAMQKCNEPELDLINGDWYILEYIPYHGAIPLDGFHEPLVSDSLLTELEIDIRGLCYYLYDISYCG